jgi:hypothetical protein
VPARITSYCRPDAVVTTPARAPFVARNFWPAADCCDDFSVARASTRACAVANAARRSFSATRGCAPLRAVLQPGDKRRQVDLHAALLDDVAAHVQGDAVADALVGGLKGKGGRSGHGGQEERTG